MNRLHSGTRESRRSSADHASPVQSPLLLDRVARRILDTESVLRLQRSTGNAAVSALLAHGEAVGRRRTGQAPPDAQRPTGRATNVVQRDIGVEFQALNVISKNKGKKKFTRKQTKSKPLKQVGGLSMEVDTGSVLEFGTGHYDVWSVLKKDLDAVSQIITEIKGLPKQALDPSKPAGASNPLVFTGFKTDYGKVDVTAEPANFFGKPQTNEEIGLPGFGSLLRENRADVAASVEAKATGLVGPTATAGLTNFMQIIVFHLQSLQRDLPSLVIADGHVKQPKAFMSLLNKTDYTAMFQSLTPKERSDFTTLVNADPNPIATAAGTTMKDDLFKVGYWGWHPDRSNMRILIKEGKIVKIQRRIKGVDGAGADKDIHSLGDPGVPARYFTTTRKIERVTVGAWLLSMITPSKRTKKSVSAPLPTYAGTKGLGYSWGLSKPSSPGAFLFEVRNQAGMPIVDWPDAAEERFNLAANCRPHSKLAYDGGLPKPPCP